MADWKPGDVVAVRAQVGTRDPVHGDLIVVVTDAKASHYSIDVAVGNVWQVPPHERLASLQAERDEYSALVEAARELAEIERRADGAVTHMGGPSLNWTRHWNAAAHKVCNAVAALDASRSPR